MTVSVAVSGLGRTSIHFVDPRVKVNGKYYPEVLLTRHLLPDIRQYSEYFIFQQDGAPAHRARETVELLKEVTPDFSPPSLWPPTSADLNSDDYAVWRIVQERVYNKDSKCSASASWTSGNVLIDGAVKCGENDCRRVLLLKKDSLNMNCDSWCNSVVATVHFDFAV